MQRFNTSVLILMAAVILAVSSCSVKEPRGSAPTIVTLILDKFAALKVSDDAKVSVISGRKMNTEIVHLPECVGLGHQVLVEKGTNTFSCAVGYEGMESKGDSLWCLPGREWCKLWRDGFVKECRDDIMYLTMEPHKEHCTVHFTIVGMPVNEQYPYDILVRGTSCGVRIHDALPIEGNFMAYASRPNLATNVLTVTVPRQQDYKMTMELIERRPDNPEKTYNPEDVMKVYSLGKIMEATGYSWNLDDLEDFSLTVDFSQAKVLVGIEEWGENDYNNEI